MTTVKFNAVITNTIKEASKVAHEGFRLLSATNQEAWLQQNVATLQSFEDMVGELESVAEENDVDDRDDIIDDFRVYLTDYLESELDSIDCAVRHERVGFDTVPKLYNVGNPELADALKDGNEYALLQSALDTSSLLIEELYELDGLALEGELLNKDIESVVREAFPNFENEIQNGYAVENYARKLLEDALLVRQWAEEISLQVEVLEDAEELYLDIMVHGIDSLFIEWLEDEGIM